MRTVVAAFVVLSLAGCLDGEDPIMEPVPLEVVAFEDVVQDREALAEVAIDERRREGVAPTLEDDGWEDRTATLTYHGLAEVHDEWARPLPAHVFRFDAQAYLISSIEIDPLSGDIDIEGEYDIRHIEYAFDAADGRFMGITDLDRGVRSFAEPGHRIPLAWGDAAPVFWSMVKMMHGNLTDPVEYDVGAYRVTQWLEAYDGQPPVPGSCTMYQQRTKIEGPGMESPSGSAAPDADPHRSLICFDESDIPVWTWSGNEKEGSRSFLRQGSGFSWPGPSGDVLEAAPFETGPMEAIEPLLPLGDSIYVPPGVQGEEWPMAIRERVAGVRAGPPYLQFDATEGPSHAHSVSAGWPPLAFGGLLTPPANPAIDITETTWVQLKADQTLFTFVHTVQSGEGVQYIPDPNGFQSTDDGLFPEYTREELGDVVHAGDVQRRAVDLAPEESGFLQWFVWPKFQEDGDPMAWWSVASHCFEAAEDPRFLMFDGLDGHLLAAGRHVSTENGCSMGTFRSSLDGQEVIIVPPGPEQRTPLVLTADGQGLALPAPRSLVV